MAQEQVTEKHPKHSRDAKQLAKRIIEVATEEEVHFGPNKGKDSIAR